MNVNELNDSFPHEPLPDETVVELRMGETVIDRETLGDLRAFAKSSAYPRSRNEHGEPVSSETVRSGYCHVMDEIILDSLANIHDMSHWHSLSTRVPPRGSAPFKKFFR